MTTHQMKRFCFRDPDEVQSGDECINCNFEQLVPGTPILAGKTGLTFRDCRLMNCTLPIDSQILGSGTKQVSHCTHLHPERIEYGQVACELDCTHVVDVDEVRIDGVLVETIYHYANTVV